MATIDAVQVELDFPAALGGLAVGPILHVPGGYGFESWDGINGVLPSFTYRTFDQARYARDHVLRTTGAVGCDTVEAFRAKYVKG